jgi:hypothetical protein
MHHVQGIQDAHHNQCHAGLILSFCRLDGRQLQVLLRELSLHRSAYKQKLLFALRQQIMTTRQDPTALASKVVVLRQMFPGDVGALVAHHPR